MNVRRRIQQRGFSLVEVVLASGIVVIIFTMILGTFSLSDDAINEGTIQTELDMKAASIAERISNDLKDAVGVVTVGGSTFPANDGIIITKGDGSAGFVNPNNGAAPNFQAGSTVKYYAAYDTSKTPAVYCLKRDVIPAGGGASTSEVLTDELSGDPANGIAALSDDVGSGSTHVVRIPTNPPPGSGVPTAQNVSRAVYIFANFYSSSGNALSFVDVGVTLGRINYRRQRNDPSDPNAYTQLSYAHTQVKLNNGCSLSTGQTGSGQSTLATIDPTGDQFPSPP